MTKDSLPSWVKQEDLIEITVNFKSEGSETEHLEVHKDKTIGEISEMVNSRFGGVAYIAFN